MATIIFLEENGESQVLTEIQNISQMGMNGDSDAQQLAKYIRQGLSQLTKVGIPPNNKMIMVSTEEATGHPRTFNLLKPIVGIGGLPLSEFRINRSTPGAFRALYFPYQYHSEQIIIFTKAVLKQGDPNPPEFQVAIAESIRMYNKFMKDPINSLSDYLEERND